MVGCFDHRIREVHLIELHREAKTDVHPDAAFKDDKDGHSGCYVLDWDIHDGRSERSMSAMGG